MIVYAIIDDVGYEKIFVVNENGGVISVFLDIANGDKAVSINVLKSTWRPQFKVKDNSIYITTDNLGQDDIYYSCAYYKKDKNYIVVQTEKFNYLGNGKFSSAELVDSVTAQEYISTNNVECSRI